MCQECHDEDFSVFGFKKGDMQLLRQSVRPHPNPDFIIWRWQKPEKRTKLNVKPGEFAGISMGFDIEVQHWTWANYELIPKPELRGFWGDSLTFHHHLGGIPNRRVGRELICPVEWLHRKYHTITFASSTKFPVSPKPTPFMMAFFPCKQSLTLPPIIMVFRGKWGPGRCVKRLQMGYFPLNHDGRKGREFLLILFEKSASLGWASARIFSAWKKAVELPKTRGMMHDCDEKNAWPSKGTAFFYSPIWVKNSLRQKCFKTTMTGFHHHHLWLAVLVSLKYIFLPWLQATTTKSLVAAGLGAKPSIISIPSPSLVEELPPQRHVGPRTQNHT